MRGQAKAPIAGQGTAPAVSPAESISALAQARTASPQRQMENQFAPAFPAPRAVGGGQYQAPKPATPTPNPYKAALDTVSQAQAGQNATGLNGNTGSAAGHRMLNPTQPEQNTISLPGRTGNSLAGQAMANAGATPEMATSAYYGDTQQKNKEAQARALYDALTGSNMDYSAMTPEMLAAQSQKLNAAGIQQQYDMQRALAAQGIGSGMGSADIAGLGVQTARNVSDAQTAAALQGQEARMQAIRDLMQGVSSSRSGDLAQQQLDYQKQQDALANKWTQAVNALGLTGGDQFSTSTLAALLNIPADQMDAFTAAVERMVRTKNPDGTISVSLQTTNPQNQVKQDSYETLSTDQQDVVHWLDTSGSKNGWSMKTPPPSLPQTPEQQAAWEAMSDANKADAWLFYLTTNGIDPRQEVPV